MSVPEMASTDESRSVSLRRWGVGTKKKKEKREKKSASQRSIGHFDESARSAFDGEVRNEEEKKKKLAGGGCHADVFHYDEVFDHHGN